jgi:DNA invertase Pin-like site-specific DNA recombinase
MNWGRTYTGNTKSLELPIQLPLTAMNVRRKAMKVIGYRRVSTGKQVTEGHGLDAQELAIKQRAALSGWDVVWADDPAMSGKNTKRPGLELALHMLKTKQAEALVVSKLDRLSRSVLDFSGILMKARDEGWNVIVLDIGLDLNTPHGELTANVLVSVAQYERQLISARTREALAAAKELKGIKPGPKPREIPVETLERARELREQGRTLANIANVLTREGFPLPSGKCGDWQGNQVHRVLLIAEADLAAVSEQ